MSSRLIRIAYVSATFLSLTMCGFAHGDAESGDPSTNPAGAAAAAVDFTHDVRPILAKHCFRCHGPQTHKSGLRLDMKVAALAGGDSGTVIEPGNSTDSLLIEYVSGTDPDFVMPPEGDRLTKEQVAVLRAWIDQGAPWPNDAHDSNSDKGPASGHWAYRPVRRPGIPVIADPEHWIRNPIDAFVLDKLNHMGLRASGEADRATLIRRLNLDLIGLLPTPAEVDAFLSDDQPDAYERLVDRLLASPHFGERWGRHWLDLARYADSDGYEKDLPRAYAWRWRDWVLDAFNSDLPFDQFTVDQLAGDLLPTHTDRQLIATGFHRNTLTNREGGVDQEEYRDKAVVDRVNTTASVWMGITLACAQCHSHKYDPFTQREYYQIYAFFNSADEKDISAPADRELAKYHQAKQAYDLAHAKLQWRQDEFIDRDLPNRFAEWSQSGDVPATDWHVLVPSELMSSGGATFNREVDGSYLVGGQNAEKDVYRIEARTDLAGITGLRLEVIPDASLPQHGPGRAADGSCWLSEISLSIVTAEGKGKSTPIPLQFAWTDLAPSTDADETNLGAEAVVDGSANTGWRISGNTESRHVAFFETEHPVFVPADNQSPANAEAAGERILIVTLNQQRGDRQTIGRFRISATTDAPPFTPKHVSDLLARHSPSFADGRSEGSGGAPAGVPIAEAKARSDSPWTEAEQQELRAFYLTIDPTYRRLKVALNEHLREQPRFPATKAQVIVQRETPRRTFVHIRGDFLNPGPQVEPGTPAVLNEFHPSSQRPTRLDLAHWLLDPAHPLTRRVAVNRIWMHLFGRGLVETQEDFGVRGSPPTHPELLDWLACEFLRGQWSRKKLIRTIVTSATYRQASRHRPELLELDPKNVLLARQNRYRLEAEVVRDLFLDASGLLNRRIGGPSIHPRLPSGVRELGYANSIRWPESKNGEQYRRGCYIFFQRTVPYPSLMTFDAPDSNVACIRRERSNTPLQALTMLNDPVFFECAQAFGRRMLRESPGDLDGMLSHAFRVCLTRPPDAAELQTLRALYGDLTSKADFNGNAVVSPAGGARGVDTPASHAAAVVALGRMLLNLDEFVTRE